MVDRADVLCYDLKVVLNLNRFYAASPYAVAMQVYASAIVYNGLRIAQARAAEQVKVAPEELSTAKLFPLMVAVAARWTAAEAYFIAVQEANPQKKLRKPDWKHAPETYVRLAEVRRETRNGKRTRRRYCASRGRWGSFAKIPGGFNLT